MGVFEEVVLKAKEVVSKAGKKTGDVLELTKLKIALAEVQNKIETAYREIGYAVYRSSTGETEEPVDVEELIQQIGAYVEESAELLEKIARLKEMKPCPSCGKENEKTAKFCSACGSNIAE